MFELSQKQKYGEDYDPNIGDYEFQLLLDILNNPDIQLDSDVVDFLERMMHGLFPNMYYENVGRQIWERAGVKPSDVDVLQLYENFTGPVVMALCEMGYCKPEEVDAFVADGALEGPDARLPFNTSGGNIAEAYIHGLEMVIEAVRQSRGDSTCQAKNVELSLAVGGPGYAPGSAVLFGPAQ